MQKIQLDNRKSIKICQEKDDELKQGINKVLNTYSGIFVLKASEIVGIDPRVTSHSLNVNPNIKPIFQKKRNFTYERQKVIAKETKKLLEAGLIKEVTHPDWVENVV